MPAKKKVAPTKISTEEQAGKEVAEPVTETPSVVAVEAVLAQRVTQKPVEATVSVEEPAPAPTRPPYPGAPLKRGDTSDSVALVQDALKCKYADGVFCLVTDQALRRWQSVQGLPVDGIVGPATWSRLSRLMS